MKKSSQLGLSTNFLQPDEIKSQLAPTRLEKSLMRFVLKNFGNPDINVSLWDGETVYPRKQAPGVVIKERSVLWRLLTHPTLSFGDDYSVGRIEIEGGLLPFLDRVFAALDKRQKESAAILRVVDLYRRVRGNPVRRAKGNIYHHYDIGNEFYQLWLDKEMVYTCAYFAPNVTSLEAAQAAKMELVCRKLRLKEGETVVDAGCGWGALALYMAREYGVNVRAFNLSREQIAFARERAEREGLSGQVEFIEDDYRNIGRHLNGKCDAFVSVGMLEHVGLKHYRELGEIVDSVLAPGGRGLIHSIGQNQFIPTNEWVDKRIFPGGYPPTLRQMMGIFEPFDLSILDVENLRLHYAQTLKHWLDRFDSQLDRVRDMYDESFVRAWRLYLCGSMANFSGGHLQLYQVLFTRARNNSLPVTRDDLFREDY